MGRSPSKFGCHRHCDSKDVFGLSNDLDVMSSTDPA